MKLKKSNCDETKKNQIVMKLKNPHLPQANKANQGDSQSQYGLGYHGTTQ